MLYEVWVRQYWIGARDKRHGQCGVARLASEGQEIGQAVAEVAARRMLRAHIGWSQDLWLVPIDN